jgi:DHA2 family multidrug resistance protein
MQSGLVLSPGGIAIIVGMPIVGFLLSRFEARWLVICGLAVSALGLFQMAHFNLDVDFRTAMMARIVQSAGLAFLFVPINTLAFAFVPKERTNYATGIINLARNIGGSCGIAMVSTMLARRAQFHQQNLVSHDAHGSGINDTLRHGEHDVEAADAVQAMQRAISSTAWSAGGRQKAFIDNFWLLGVTFLAVIR